MDLVARQMLEPRTCRVAEVERQVLDHEEIVGRPTGVAREPVVLEPYTGVGVPVVSRHVGRSPEARGELHVTDAPAKSPLSHPILQGKPNASHMCARINLHTHDRQKNVIPLQ
jgi:hypothetical protein